MLKTLVNVVNAGPDILDNVSETSITNENDEANHSDKESHDADTRGRNDPRQNYEQVDEQRQR